MPEPSHTLARGANGNPGNLLADALDLLAPRPTIRSDDADEYRRAAERRRADVERARELAAAAAELHDIEHEAAVLRRRVTRQKRALERAAQLEAARSAGGMYANERRSPNRPCHAEVDPEAWEIVKREAIRRRTPVGQLVGTLVALAADRGIRRTHQTTHQQRTRRFTRLLDLDETTWSAFRVRAHEADLRVADALGLLVEHEARRLEWTEEPGT